MSPNRKFHLRVPRVNVVIDRLVVGGLDPAARNALVDGLRTHLEAMLADPVTLASLSSGARSRRTPVLRLGRLSLPPGISGARNLGRQLARAIASCGSPRLVQRRVRP